MGALFVLILVLAVHSFVLPGAGEGLAFYLLPDWNRAAEMGIGNVIVAAMNQAFFTLSLGVGAMEIFGSYMSRIIPWRASLCASARWIPAWPSVPA